MRKRSAKPLAIALLSGSLILTGCGMGGQSAADVQGSSSQDGSQQQSSGQQKASTQPGYSEIKSIVLDVLHSKEGMATLKDTISSPDFKRSAAVTENDISAAVEKTLQQGQNKSFLTQQMKDTKFAAAVVEASKTQMTQVQRQLMKDPEYQKELLTIMKSPEFLQTQFELLKSPEYRKEIMAIMTEALQQPTFRLLFQDSMKQAVKDAGGGQKDKASQSQKQGKDQQSGGGSDQGGSEGNEQSGDSGGS